MSDKDSFSSEILAALDELRILSIVVAKELEKKPRAKTTELDKYLKIEGDRSVVAKRISQLRETAFNAICFLALFREHNPAVFAYFLECLEQRLELFKLLSEGQGQDFISQSMPVTLNQAQLNTEFSTLQEIRYAVGQLEEVYGQLCQMAGPFQAFRSIQEEIYRLNFPNKKVTTQLDPRDLSHSGEFSQRAWLIEFLNKKRFEQSSTAHTSFLGTEQVAETGSQSHLQADLGEHSQQSFLLGQLIYRLRFPRHRNKPPSS
jgi:hypothetical protein